MLGKISRRLFFKRFLALLAFISPYRLLKAYAGRDIRLEPGDGEGQAFIKPSETVIGKVGNYRIIFKVGPSGIAKGGSIRIDLPSNSAFHGLEPKLNWTKPQTGNPYGGGFVKAYPDNKVDITIETFEHIFSKQKSYRIRLSAITELLPDENILVLYVHARAQWIPQLNQFPIFTDTDGNGRSNRISKVPNINVKGGSARQIRVTIPSVLEAGGTFDLKVSILDELGYRASGYSGIIRFQTDGVLNNLQDSYTFGEEDYSVHVFTGVSFQWDGIFTIIVDDGSMSGESNPCEVFASAPPYNLYWGDLHWHSKASDGLRSSQEGFRYARDITCLDFTAMTDHDALLDPRDMWGYACDIANSFNTFGKFVTLISYEWTAPSATAGGPGHKNVYYAGEKAPLLSYKESATSQPDGLWSHLEDLDAVTIPHHVAKPVAATDWSYRNDELQPLAEIYSNHGNSEFDGASPQIQRGVAGNYVQDALEMGHKLGFIASTDSHYTLPGGNEFIASKGVWQAIPALTAVYAPSLTRQDLFEHIKSRHTYATTGKRVLLSFTMNESFMMGDEFAVAHPPKLYIWVVGAGSFIDKVEIIRDNAVIHLIQPASETCEVSFKDDGFSNLAPGTTHYYYVRVTLEETFSLGWLGGGEEFPHLAWSSPIWVTKN